MITGKSKIDLKELIESNLNDWDLFKFYFGDFKIGGLYHSPLRNDNNPSFSFYISKSGSPKAKDFATGDNYTAIEYVKALFHLDYNNALKKIASDFNLEKIDFKAIIVKKEHEKVEIVKKKKEIKIIAKQFSKEDLNYWKSFGIENYETLKLFNVYSVKEAYLNTKRIGMKKNELCFAYFFPKSNHVKLYRPLAEKINKWLSNTDNLCDIQGYWQCNPKETKPELLILTSSLKEVMFLRERGIYAMAINGENHKFHEDFLRHLKKYCKNILSLYDKDEAGYKGAKYLEDKYQIARIELPDFYCEEKEIKDVTDAYKYCDKEQVKKFIETITVGDAASYYKETFK